MVLVVNNIWKKHLDLSQANRFFVGKWSIYVCVQYDLDNNRTSQQDRYSGRNLESLKALNWTWTMALCSLALSQIQLIFRHIASTTTEIRWKNAQHMARLRGWEFKASRTILKRFQGVVSAQDFDRIWQERRVKKSQLLGNFEFTLILGYKAKSYVNSGSYDEAYGKNCRPTNWIGKRGQIQYIVLGYIFRFICESS